MNSRTTLLFAIFIFALTRLSGADVEVASLAELARVAAQDGQHITLRPGVYRMADYLTEAVLAEIKTGVDHKQARPPVPMFVFRGSHNDFDFKDVVIEIDTSLYRLVPQKGYTRCFIIAGDDNRFKGLTIRSTGANQGSNGNLLSVAGAHNTLEDFVLQIHGSFPYGYGDLLGKGGPNLVPLQKQSGIQVLGTATTLRRCKVFSRALGHCFYIQGGEDILVEDCYAEGSMRSTTEMLRDTSGPAFDLGFKSVYENRDGRYMITPGYMKCLSEDGFRTYGGAGSIVLRNCIAIHTRAGFEIAGKEDATVKTQVIGCVARGCERAFLIGSNTIVRRSSGDIAHGPLLYLRGGHDSDVEIELTGEGPESLVHVVATIAGENHRVRLTARDWDGKVPALPILLGYGMPAAAEMSSPIRAARAHRITLLNELDRVPIVKSEQVTEEKLETKGRVMTDAELRKSPGPS